ncbi:MAG: hypothetical protein GF384_08730 [Elusimicrobia bacterium]|nr:hypothetical protein [Elusimicrobiota bacterium]MBD3412696.1 hypothetical protein [Elusimicrobiota bacterium]
MKYLFALSLFSLIYWIVFSETATWLINTWRYDTLYLHGFIIAIVCVGLMLYNSLRIRMNKIQYKASIPFLVLGVLIMVAGVVFHFKYLVASAYSLIGVGITVASTKKHQSRTAVIPFFFLFLIYPIPFLSQLSGYLSYRSAVIVGFILKIIYPGLMIEGIAITIPPDVRFMIGNECSGAHPIFALITVLIFWLIITKNTFLLSITTVSAGIIIGFLVNISRIIIVFLIAAWQGIDTAIQFWHTWAGYFFYILSLGITALVWIYLKKRMHQKITLRKIVLT